MSSVNLVRGSNALPQPATGNRESAGSQNRAPRREIFPMRKAFSASAETFLAIGVVTVVALLVVPQAPFMLDALLALSFGLSIAVLLVTLSAREPLDFSVFPSLLLLITLFRLGLNVSSTRLILSTAEPGKVIAAFGNFVISGNVVVGLVIFLILVVINFVVITKGAGRIAEVAARFTLDAMPGRQMSIDADLGAGLIDETEARQRREQISRYADFYGSMDGAAKFVRGDAIAGIVITLINLIGGFIIGIAQKGLSAGEALSTYSSLTVGDGLVTQIPALIVSTAAGILVTYGSSGTAVAPSIGSQLTRNPRAIWTVAAILALFAAVPGLPLPPFLFLAGVAALIAYRVTKRVRAKEAEEDRAEREGAAAGETPPGLQELLAVEPLELEVGYGLVPLVDEAQKGDLVTRVGILRKQLALEMGIIVPPTRIRDNIQLRANEYVIKLRGVRVASGQIEPQRLMALNTSGAAPPLEGNEVRDPSFGIPAFWIDPDLRVRAQSEGYTVVEAQTVLATHLMETIRDHAAELLSRQDTRELLDRLKQTHPALVEDVIPNKVALGTVHRVLQKLLRERVPIRDLVTILESLSDAAEQTKDPEVLAESVRRSLSLVLVQLLGGHEGPVRAITVGPKLELALMALYSPREKESGRSIEPEQLTAALESLGTTLASRARDGQVPALVTPPALRVGIRRLVEPSFPRVPVISLAELPPQTPLQTISVWELPNAA